MKFSHKSALVTAAVATALGSASVFAATPLTPAQVAAIPAANIFYAGGGSAQVNAVIWAVTQQLQPGTISYFTDAAACANSSDYVVLSGVSNVKIGSLPVGSDILFFYKFNGGSFPNGVAPQVSNGSTLAYPTQASLASAGTCAGPYPLPTYSYSANTGATAVPDWGVSDVEVPLFNYADNLPSGTLALTPTQLASVHQTAIYDNLFGVAVTNTLYLNGGAPPGQAGYNPATQKTNFTKEEVAAILAGTFQNWNQLFADDGKTPLAAGAIFLADRGKGSGSKASGNQYFLTYPGAKLAGGAVDPGSVTFGYVPSGATSINPALTTYQDVSEGSSGALVKDLQAVNTAGKRAIGILGAEFPPAANQAVAGTNAYYFASIDGVGIDTGYDNATVASPVTGNFHDNINTTSSATGLDANSHKYGTSYTNVVSGAYDYFYQNSLNTRTAANFSAPNGAAFETLIQGSLQNSAIAGANSNLPFNPGAQAVPGLLLDAPTVGGIVAGTVTGTRNQNSTSPLQNVVDATNAPIPLGFDPIAQ